MRYTEEDLEKARVYIRSRIENEISMQNDVGRLLDEYARKLVDLVYKGVVKDGNFRNSSEVEALIDELITRLIDDCMTLAVDEHDSERDNIIAYVGREWKGDDLQGRVGKRAWTFADEVVTTAVAAVAMGVGKSKALKSIRNSSYRPWENDIIVSAREKVFRGELSLNGLDLNARHYGHGIPISSEKGLADITLFGVGEGWMYYDYIFNKAAGAIGFIPVRSSSIPCDICDDHANRFHFISEDAPQYHLHCVCAIIWIYKKD